MTARMVDGVCPKELRFGRANVSDSEVSGFEVVDV